MFSASRNSVSSSRVVGKTLNSTGLRMYIATIITITDIMMSVTIRTSSRKPGSGVISAITIPSTASGTPSSRQLRERRPPGAVASSLSAPLSLLPVPISCVLLSFPTRPSACRSST